MGIKRAHMHKAKRLTPAHLGTLKPLAAVTAALVMRYVVASAHRDNVCDFHLELV